MNLFNRFNQLGFVIGIFFILVALVLLIGYGISEALHRPINLYSGLLMLAFGIFMIRVKDEE
ncbi:MAG: hypothetical protein ACK43J_02405 [Chitinophagaceae bacterium]|jgi:hypothetical protein|nr:hypothetical protein [Flavobacteriia bacterium]